MSLLYMIQVNVFSFLILVFIYFGMTRKKEISNVHQRIFSMLLLANALLLVTDFSVTFFDYLGNSVYFIPLFVSATLLYLLVPIPGYLWLLYVEYFIFKDLTRYKEWKRLFFIPVVINTTMVIVNLFTPLIFSVSQVGVYQREVGYWFISAIAFSYLFMSIIHLVYYRKKIRKRDFSPMVFFVIPVFIGAILQIFFYGLLTVWTSLSLSMLMIYLFIQSRIIQTDYLTGLYNRREFDVKLSDLSKTNLKNTILGLLLIDIDDFKNINDKYGHPMGDLALQALSNVLKQNFRLEDFVARLGGDEFGVILELEHLDDIKQVISRLEASLEIYNLSNHLPFNIALSIGYGAFEGKKQHSLNDFIKEVDDQMYIQKHNKKKILVNHETGNHY